MALKVRARRRDQRVEQILRDPKGYFAQARQRAESEVKAEMAQERVRLRRRTA